jgi:hypothetical protein
MTYVDVTKFDGIVRMENKLEGFEEAMWSVIDSHVTEWLKGLRVDVYPYKGKLRIVLDVYLHESQDEIIFDMPFEEFYQLRNDEPPEMEEFIIAGLKYYREVYEKEPEEEYKYDDEEI